MNKTAIVAAALGFSLVILLSGIKSIITENRNSQIEYENNVRSEQIKCLKLAERTKNDNWYTECHRLRLGSDCLLPSKNADRIQKAFISDKITCQELYK